MEIIDACNCGEKLPSAQDESEQDASSATQCCGDQSTVTAASTPLASSTTTSKSKPAELSSSTDGHEAVLPPKLLAKSTGGVDVDMPDMPITGFFIAQYMAMKAKKAAAIGGVCGHLTRPPEGDVTEQDAKHRFASQHHSGESQMAADT